ncbi:hypothetical protein Tco_0244818, partial [Tanacetum coccineum]
MSDSEDSTVTYTSVSFLVEEDSDIGSPGIDGPPTMPEDLYAYIMAAYEVPPLPDYIPGPEVPPSPDYIPGPEVPPSSDYIPGPEVPQSPPLLDYVPEDDDDDEEEEEDEPSGDDADDEDEDEDEDEEEEEEQMEEVEPALALTTPPSSPLTPLPSLLPQIPSPPL